MNVLMPQGSFHAHNILMPFWEWVQYGLAHFDEEFKRELDVDIYIGAHLADPNQVDDIITSSRPYVVYNTEISSVWPVHYSRLLQSAIRVWHYSSVYVNKPTEDWVPLHMFDKPRPEEIERDIDFLFYGSMNERRRDFMCQMKTKGHEVTIAPFGTYGEQLSNYLNRTKVVLSPHYHIDVPQPVCSPRIIQATAHGCWVVSEMGDDFAEWPAHAPHFCDTPPYEVLADFDEVSTSVYRKRSEDLIYQAIANLRTSVSTDAERVERVREYCQEQPEAQYTGDSHIKKILELLR